MTPFDVETLFREHHALLEGHFQLSSGLHSSRYLQSALVLQHPLLAAKLGEAIAAAMHHTVREKIDLVVAPAMGGLIIGHEVARALGAMFVFTERVDGAMTLRRGFTIPRDARVVIVEDVITTGKSTREVMDVIKPTGAVLKACAAIVDRSGGAASFDVPLIALLPLTVPTYAPPECPACQQHVPVEKPGSRFVAR